MYTIETPRLGLRPWKQSDLRVFTRMGLDPRVMEYFPGLLTPQQSLDMIGRIREFMEANHYGLWAVEIKKTGAFIGYTGFSVPRFKADFTPCVEIGWRLAFPYWSRGYATEAAAGCMEYGFTALGFEEIVSFTAAINKRSVRVMERIGMQYCQDFEHPALEDGSPLKTHVLYKKRK